MGPTKRPQPSSKQTLVGRKKKWVLQNIGSAYNRIRWEYSFNNEKMGEFFFTENAGRLWKRVKLTPPRNTLEKKSKISWQELSGKKSKENCGGWAKNGFK